MADTVTRLAYTAGDVSAFAACVHWPSGHGVPPTFPIRLMMQAAAPFMRHLDEVMRARGVRLVHATQTLSVLAPMPPAAQVEVKVTTGDIPEAGAKERRLSVTAEVTGADGGVLATLKSGLMLLPDLPTGGGKTVAVPDGAVETSFSEADLRAYADASHDFNPIHTDPAAARALGLPRPVVHGMLLLGRMVSVVAAACPDRPVGTIDCLFLSPVLADDPVRLAVETPAGPRVRFQIVHASGVLAVSGSVRPPA